MTTAAVRKASKDFYAALNRMLKGDSGPLVAIWSHSASVTTMHPIGGREVGWVSVKEVWDNVAQAMTGGEVTLNDPLIRVAGDMAYEVGTEKGYAVLGGQRVEIDNRVTNVYRHEAKGWRIFHHHTDISAAMQDAVRRLQAK